MTEKVKRLLGVLKSKEYRKRRSKEEIIFSSEYETLEHQEKVFRYVAEKEKPLFYEEDSFGFNRYTAVKVPQRKGNVSPDYIKVIQSGLDKVVSDISESIKNTSDPEREEYGRTMLGLISVCFDIAEKYKKAAEKTGNIRLYNALLKIPHHGAKNLYEALVFLKFCIYSLRLYGANHLTLGRFDQYMYSFYQTEKKAGKSNDEILEMIEEFFISLNYDTDLYHGIQQGDNGQSMVLGGFDKDGNSMYNELSEICMKASLELCLIDPKINLRVGKNTSDAVYEFATLLTKQGLGFPQYCNDDVVVPGLIKLGYTPEDAQDYAVAACWEHIIPGKGADVVGISTMDFPAVVNRAITSNLIKCNTFEALMCCVENEIATECANIINEKKDISFPPEPLLSIFMDNCVEKLADIWEHGTVYMNFGCHGAGISNAVDALVAVRKNIYDCKTISKETLLSALSENFEGYTEIRNLLRNSPKMGNNDDYADEIAAIVLDAFSLGINGKDNGHGGVWRAGTGSAMEYIWKGDRCPATADGRLRGDAYSSSFSPSLDVKTSGLLSVISSFTKYNMSNIINGGPLTVEIHDTVLRNEIGIKKTAQLVKNFILLGGHQLQLNSINRERLIDAQNHPENYPHLITRVWGWSGYLNELDVKYQDHIIRRCEFFV